MPQFIVTAHDYTDPQALERRMSVREAHLENVRKLKADGKFVIGGATLDAEGKMNGSVAIFDFPTQEELEAFLSTDPYVAGRVWETYEIKPYRVANV
ncbi:hypothetical protein SAMN05421823_106260 [Catalinimonas alkaloidigena]|uniref:YCII-related domain-containing protein n=1 Tax=Catalinimonas alkaloidigena TaxID=1075417 RepID=A0A1G9KUW1_9BACT|nr:YciI family protein [Catalinimonas alkaloidigena]SDL53399.1 hypothetical protein SAMN05421823_106260 [Catalinimonas alkaloidigena]